MSANNVVWIMIYRGKWHVFYSGCFDNTPKEPDYKDEYYNCFLDKNIALIYAYEVADTIGVEYGVCQVPNEIVLPKPREDGCYQFIYCNECLAYPMGIGCPNLVKGPVQLKDEIKKKEDSPRIKAFKNAGLNVISTPEELEAFFKKDFMGWRDCNECDLYGECDHQGAYKKDGKWCYEELTNEPKE